MRSVISLGFVALTVAASAQLYNVNATLLPENETHLVTGSSATGTAVGLYDATTNQLTLSVSASNFTSNVTMAHIHGFAAQGSNAGVRINFGVEGTGSTSYNRSNMTFTLPQADEANYLAGLSYVNIHTATWGPGEVRGQLLFTPVPEPASMAVVGLGLAAFRRRRRA